MRGLKIGALAAFVVSMLVLLIGGLFAKERVPPIPDKVMAGEEVLFTGEDIWNGLNTYQKYGLMDHGSVWGHGTIRGPDFSALTLNLMGRYMREYYAAQKGGSYEALPAEERAAIDAKVISEIKENRYDPSTGTLRLTPAQAHAWEKIREYWTRLLTEGDKDYGFLPGTIKGEEEGHQISAFFFWTAWAASTKRPGLPFSYTNNWPPDRSVGNVPPSEALIYSVLAILALLAILGLVVYLLHKHKFFLAGASLESGNPSVAETVAKAPLSPSQVKVAKFFVVVGLLFLLQVLLGGLLASYTVKPREFYGVEAIYNLIPYGLAKTWHLQLAVFWIATSWVAAALFIAPLLAGKEPKGQPLLVDILFVAVLVVALGSLLGEAAGMRGLLGKAWFWVGHEGWEYLELGRLWKFLLILGLLAWLFVVYRTLKERLSSEKGKPEGDLLFFFLLSAILIVAFYCFGIFYGRRTHITIADYWRWFVVHIWVEGMFEIFSTAVVALLLSSLGLVKPASALRVVYFTAILVFSTGIIGTAHHYFWYGGPSYWMALGAVFSSMEPVPLILLVVRAFREYRLVAQAGEAFPYRIPFLFLVATSFWYFVGAGVFGFIINLPIVNYYEHATYLTLNHGHTALFGVYGMLALSLLLFCWRSMVREGFWNERWLRTCFWLLNGGLALMSLLTLFPVGVIQLLVSYNDGLWAARDASFYNIPLVKALLWARMAPDLAIILGALLFLLFLLKTCTKLRPVGAGA